MKTKSQWDIIQEVLNMTVTCTDGVKRKIKDNIKSVTFTERKKDNLEDEKRVRI